MRILLSLLSFIAVCTAGAFVSSAQPVPAAKPAGLFCDKAESTADLLECANRRHEEAMARLNTVFENLSKPQTTQDEENPAARRDDNGRRKRHNAQHARITYRNAECAWEKSLSETPSTERIDELSCLSDLTAERTERLALAQGRENEGRPREYGTWPRWVNVLSGARPDAFWRYGTALEADFDCDGTVEHILKGLALQDDGAPAIMIAVVEDPPIGLPEAQVFSLPVRPDPATEEDAGVSVCSADMMMTLTETDDNEKAGECGFALRLHKDGCAAVLLSREGEDYALGREKGNAE